MHVQIWIRDVCQDLNQRSVSKYGLEMSLEIWIKDLPQNLDQKSALKLGLEMHLEIGLEMCLKIQIRDAF